ncbi:MAG: glycoside hydrolase family 2 protein [Solobacterium sp.]|nr:glycoside hydrolase family 2 protein [Solobacterium sp.]
MIRLNNDWEFTETWSEAFLEGSGSAQKVRIPHTSMLLPLHYIDPNDYQMICGYRRELKIDETMKGKRLFLQFDAAAHIATVYFNGKELGTHYNGYTAFRYEITDEVNYGGTNRIAVKLDTTENSKIPPFGFVIDYLTFGGIYRDVWLDVRGSTYVKDLFVETPDLTHAVAHIELDGEIQEGLQNDRLILSVSDESGTKLREVSCKAGSGPVPIEVPEAVPWQVGKGTLYRATVRLMREDAVLDEKTVLFGFRTVSLTENEILINGEPVFLRGLNRHQSFPYVGYAATESLQREDARILDEELCVNTVRTSHYPQSHYFIDECDRRGILVFTEIPGWQHLSKEEFWRNQCVQNVKEMVTEYRNHPSIILWGVRVNESLDDDELYTRTNAAAHELDQTRFTSGVRYLEKSHLLEDIYAFNDFSHNGITPGAKPKKDVTTDMKKPLLISEANGHMYPTKPFDSWKYRQEQALRHARVMNQAKADGTHAGVIQWVMFDYPTHKDFGSGDRICYHGVLDSFRNPKLAAAVYASQKEERPVLEIGNSMDIGDYDAGNLGDIYAFTNADHINLYINDVFVKSFEPKGWDGMKHGPILIDDTIGERLETQEHMPKRKAAMIRDCMLAAGRYGFSALPAWYKAKLAYIMLRYKMSFEEGYELYGKYVGNWGSEATVWRFDAVRGEEVIASVLKTPGQSLHLHTAVSNTVLKEGDVYDMAAVRIQIKDENGNPAPYAQLPVSFSAEGPIEILGPKTAVLEGGSTGLYIRTTGKPGTAVLTIHSDGLEDQNIQFEVR